MEKKQKVIVSSVSDCREKNGIVTFMEILARNASRFEVSGLDLAFANYVDLQLSRAEVATTVPALEARPTAPVAPSLPFRTRLKRKVKEAIRQRPFPAFALFLGTLGMRGLMTAIKARRYDEPGCVHFYQDFLTASFGCFLHHKTARRVIILHSGDDALSQLFAHFPGMKGTRYERRVRQWFDWTLQRQHAIVALSEKYASDLRGHYPKHEVRCIYNTSPFAGTRSVGGDSGRPQDRIKLVAVGTLQYRKGFDMLIKAVASMPLAERNKLEVTIVGGGPSHGELDALIDQYGLNGRITLAGESHNVAAFLQPSDVYILTSRDEGLPISLIEACSFGLPIISTPVGSIPELFDDASCRFAHPSEDSIADALMALCTGKLDLENLSRQSKRIFDSKLSLENFLGSYINLLSGKPIVKS
ncbi:MAG: glycosyltransferase [Pandoraea sp.]|nr:glycosyltransferase [Pandoraea sp.]MDR3399317.1 glycosyltransferase [Pandoraea sp.]